MLSGFKNFAITFCIALIIFSVIAFFIVDVAKDNLIPVSGDVSAENPEIVDPSVTDESGNPVVDPDESFTVLLIGTDYQPDVLNDYDVSGYSADGLGFPIRPRKVMTDTLILVHVNGTTRTIQCCSLPCNLRTSVGGGYASINTLYANYGIDTLLSTVCSLTGVDVDYYALADLSGFAAVIDSIGGLVYNVPVDMYYIDESQSLEIDLKRGEINLDGENALKMLRYTSYSNGNSSRMALGLEFLRTLITKLSDYSTLETASALYTSLSSLVQTNFTLDDLAKHIGVLTQYQSYSFADNLTYPATSLSEEGEDFLDPALSTAIDTFFTWRK